MILECERCGGNLKLASDGKTAVCEYCGLTTILSQSVELQKTVDSRGKQKTTRKPYLATIFILLPAIIVLCIVFSFNEKTAKVDESKLLNSEIQVETDTTIESKDQWMQGEYDYDTMGLFGLSNQVRIGMAASEVKRQKAGDTVEARQIWLIYDDNKFMSKYKGKLIFVLQEENGMVQRVSLLVKSPVVEATTLVNEISQRLGEPIHKENINDLRYDVSSIVWEYAKNQLLIARVRHDTNSSSVEIVWREVDTRAREQFDSLNEVINKDDALKQEYTKLFDRGQYISRSIAEALETYTLEVKKITTAFRDDLGFDFQERSSLFGYDGVFAFHCDSPDAVKRPGFIGQIEYVEFQWDELSEDEQVEIFQKLTQLFGEPEENGYGGYMWENAFCRLSSYLDSKLTPYISLRWNVNFCTIDPSYRYSDATNVIPAEDCDISIFNDQ